MQKGSKTTKKWFPILLAMVVILLAACGGTTKDSSIETQDRMDEENIPTLQTEDILPETTIDEEQPFEKMVEAGLTEDQIEIYELYGDIYDDFSLEDYIQLCKSFEDAEDVYHEYMYLCDNCTWQEYCDAIIKVRTITGEKRALLAERLNEKMYFVDRNVSTYDRVDNSVAIVSLDGEVVTDWNPVWKARSISKFSNYFLVRTYSDAYGFCSDIVNLEGKVIANLEHKSTMYDLGEGYIYVTRGAEAGRIMNPQGEIIELKEASVWPSFGWKNNGELAEDEEIGKISEGLFYAYGKGNVNTVAYYYNTRGEVVIDLSTTVVNYEVTKMHDFENGKAKIEFKGADYKRYEVYIDKTGEFIGEPVEI